MFEDCEGRLAKLGTCGSTFRTLTCDRRGLRRVPKVGDGSDFNIQHLERGGRL